MKKIISTLLVAGCCLTSLMAQDVVVKGPDEKLQLVVFTSPTEKPSYSITYNGKTMLEKSPLGMNTNIGDFAKGMKLTGIRSPRLIPSIVRIVLKPHKCIIRQTS